MAHDDMAVRVQVYGPVADLVKRPRIFPEFEHIMCVRLGGLLHCMHTHMIQ
jgi:hypothetical protein